MSDPLVVSIVVNWNLGEELGECLESLRTSDYSNHKIVVVDNGSTDNSVSFVSENYKDVHLIALEENRGYAAGLNEGIRWALQQDCDYIFALNNDILVRVDTISKLVNTLVKYTDIGIATPKVMIKGTDKLFGLGDRRYWWLPLPLGVGYGKKDRVTYQGLLEFDYVPGCAMMIRKSTIASVGYFDTSYFMYYEDADFCRRVRELGYRIVCCCECMAYHKVGRSSQQNRYNLVKIRAENKVRFFRKHRHGFCPFFTFVLLWIMAYWYTFRLILRGEYVAIFHYWRGFLRGWR